MTITSKHEQTIEEDHSCVAIARHWVLIDLAQLRLSLQIERLIQNFEAAFHGTICTVAQGSLEALATKRIGMINRVIGEDKTLAEMVDCDTFLEVALPHLREVALKASIVAEQDSCALHLAISR